MLGASSPIKGRRAAAAGKGRYVDDYDEDEFEDSIVWANGTDTNPSEIASTSKTPLNGKSPGVKRGRSKKVASDDEAYGTEESSEESDDDDGDVSVEVSESEEEEKSSTPPPKKTAAKTGKAKAPVKNTKATPAAPAPKKSTVNSKVRTEPIAPVKSSVNLSPNTGGPVRRVGLSKKVKSRTLSPVRIPPSCQ